MRFALIVAALVVIILLLGRGNASAQPPQCPGAPVSITEVTVNTPFRVGGCVDTRDTNGQPATLTEVRLSRNGNQIQTIPASAFVASTDTNFRYWEVTLTETVVGTVTFSNTLVIGAAESASAPFPALSVLPAPSLPRVPTGNRILQ